MYLLSFHYGIKLETAVHYTNDNGQTQDSATEQNIDVKL